MVIVKYLLKTKYDSKLEQLLLHLQQLSQKNQNTGLMEEFQVKIGENPLPIEEKSCQSSKSTSIGTVHRLELSPAWQLYIC
jgi:hypothetical protein